MTQSKDGPGRTPGTPSRSTGQQTPGATGSADKVADKIGKSDFPMLPHPSMIAIPMASQPAADTDEMQDLLRKIANQIAEAEQRQGDALDGMQSRLAGLAEQTEAIKSEAPKNLQGDLTAIENRIADIAETVEAAGRDIKSGDATAASPASPGAGAASANIHVRGFGRGQVRGSNEGISPPQSTPKVPVVKVPASATTHPSASPSHAPEAGGPWDQASADALARIFSDEEEAVGKHRDASQKVPNTPVAVVASSVRTAVSPAAFESSVQAGSGQRAPFEASSQPRLEPPALASAQSGHSQPKPPAAAPGSLTGGFTGGPSSAARGVPPIVQTALPSATSFSRTPAPLASSAQANSAAVLATSKPASGAIVGADRDWLNTRFAEIAAQIERSLKESRPDRALSAMGQRFDKLESSLATVMTVVRSNADQSAGAGASQTALETLDGHVNGLKAQVEAAVRRLESLDALKVDVAAISQRLGTLDRLEQAQTQVTAHLTGTRSSIDHLTRAFDEQASMRAGTALPLAGVLATADPRLDVLQDLLEAQVAERREGESATVAVLQAIQSAIDRLTHRMGEFEEAVAAAVLGGPEQHADQHDAPGHGDVHAAGQNSNVHRTPDRQTQAAKLADVPLATESQSMSDASTSGRGAARPAAFARAPEALVAVQIETAIPRTRRGLGNIVRPGGDAPAAGRASEVDEGPIRSSRRNEQPGSPAGREDMAGAARRAAHPSALDGGEPEVDVETIASRLPGQKRLKPRAARGGFFTFEKAGSRPIQVVALVALLAAGAGMLYGTMAERPQPVPARIEKPKAPAGKIGALPSSPSEAQRADTRMRGSDGALGANTASRRSMDDDGLDGTVAEMRAADLKEAALSILKPSADTEAAPMHTSSSLSPGRSDGHGITTGILIDSGAPMPSIHDLKRYSEEQRMARISSQLGDKAVQKTQREHPSPASHTPDAVKPDVSPESAPAAVVAAPNAGGLPPAQIGPMSLRVAAAKGDPSAEFEVASRFAQGKGIPKDFVKAAEWYQRAASRGSAPAQYRLGGLYERGIGVKPDPARARAWYRRAAELGNVKAMHNLAVMHTQRDGVGEPDYASASQWFSKAASYGLSDSQFNLAILHENGMGLPKSTAEAYKWYALAAERGDPEAVKRRDSVAGRLAPADVERSRMAVAKWRPQMIEPVANDPMMAGQAWRHRNGEDQIGAQSEGQPLTAPSRPALKSSAAPTLRAAPQEAEIIDLSSATIDAQMKSENAVASGNGARTMGAASFDSTVNPPAPASAEQQAIMNRKRKVTKVQNPADVERMLTQFGYNPAALKKARPGEDTEQAAAVAAQPE
jgi:localization factor PodJL